MEGHRCDSLQIQPLKDAPYEFGHIGCVQNEEPGSSDAQIRWPFVGMPMFCFQYNKVFQSPAKLLWSLLSLPHAFDLSLSQSFIHSHFIPLISNLLNSHPTNPLHP